MAYRLPTFNGNVSIWHGQADNGTTPLGGPIGPPDEFVVCQLRSPRQPSRVDSNYEIGLFDGTQTRYEFYQTPYYLLVPKDTDLRGTTHSTGPDIVQVELLTLGNPYLMCLEVRIVALGFSNEYVRGLCITPEDPTP